ncbi:putative hepatitis A virus cellular receptor 2 like protein [Cricetulus griseus]|nr:putative hepatitis A virus cellular receptor 2 like protein [Cricetulus griseus]
MVQLDVIYFPCELLMFSRLTFNCVLLLLLLLLARSLEDAVIVEVGKNAYLPCSYTLPTPGTPVPVCWGKGPCPWSRCGSGVLSTDERNVTYQKSRRYQLRGNFLKGDVSLTIENVTVDDHGTYCCRVEFPGLGNDKKLDLKLVIIPARTSRIILKKYRESVQPCLVPDFRGIGSSFSPFNLMLAIGLLYIMLRL